MLRGAVHVQEMIYTRQVTALARHTSLWALPLRDMQLLRGCPATAGSHACQKDFADTAAEPAVVWQIYKQQMAATVCDNSKERRYFEGQPCAVVMASVAA